MLSDTVILAGIICAIATFFLGLFAKPICAKFGLMDIPDARKQHKITTPLAGGLALTLIIVPLAILLILFATPASSQPTLMVWLGATAAMAILGMADDRHTLAARDRLLVSLLIFASAAVFDPMFNVRVLTFEHPLFELGLGTGFLAIIFTTICGVGLVNAVNMADGKNGLVIGLCIGWLSLLALRAPQPLLPIIFLLVAALFILLVFNLCGRLFLGDGGAYGLATAIGLIAIITYNTKGDHAGRAISADELVLLFAVPVIDSFRLTFARVSRGRSPMAADRDHLHHHLLDLVGWPRGLFVYLFLAIAPPALLFVLDA